MPEVAVPTEATALEKLSAQAKRAADVVLNVGVDGKVPWKGSVEVAEQHLAKHGDVEKAIQRLIATHVRLTSSTGFLSGLGGLITLPVALPADFTALWLTQARLASAIAHLRGYDVRSEEVRSVVLISLLGDRGAVRRGGTDRHEVGRQRDQAGPRPGADRHQQEGQVSPGHEGGHQGCREPDQAGARRGRLSRRGHQLRQHARRGFLGEAKLPGRQRGLAQRCPQTTITAQTLEGRRRSLGARRGP